MSACRSHSELQCRQITGEPRDGGLLPLMLAELTYATPIPDESSDAEAALLCRGITTCGAVDKAARSPGRPVGSR